MWCACGQPGSCPRLPLFTLSHHSDTAAATFKSLIPAPHLELPVLLKQLHEFGLVDDAAVGTLALECNDARHLRPRRRRRQACGVGARSVG